MSTAHHHSGDTRLGSAIVYRRHLTGKCDCADFLIITIKGVCSALLQAFTRVVMEAISFPLDFLSEIVVPTATLSVNSTVTA